MFSQCTISEQSLSAEQDYQHIFANNLKRKLETGQRNGFTTTMDNELCTQRQDNCITSEVGCFDAIDLRPLLSSQKIFSQEVVFGDPTRPHVL